MTINTRTAIHICHLVDVTQYGKLRGYVLVLRIAIRARDNQMFLPLGDVDKHPDVSEKGS